MSLWTGLKRQLTTLNVKYLGGHPEMPTKRNVGVDVVDGKLVLLGGMNFESILEIPLSDVESITLDRASKRSAGKAAAGAIIGGALTGGVGLIAGAAIGGKKKDDSIIVVTIKYSNISLEMYFGGENVKSKYGQFVKLLGKK